MAAAGVDLGFEMGVLATQIVSSGLKVQCMCEKKNFFD